MIGSSTSCGVGARTTTREGGVIIRQETGKGAAHSRAAAPAEVVGREPAANPGRVAHVDQPQFRDRLMRRPGERRKDVGAGPPRVEAGGCRRTRPNVGSAHRVGDSLGDDGLGGRCSHDRKSGAEVRQSPACARHQEGITSTDTTTHGPVLVLLAVDPPTWHDLVAMSDTTHADAAPDLDLLLNGSSGVTTKSIESWLWQAACSIRGALDAPKYKDYILPLIFLKRLSDVYDDELSTLADRIGGAERARRAVAADRKLVRIYLPQECSWSRIRNLKEHVGEQITSAFRKLTKENPPLRGVVDVVDFNAAVNGQRIIDDERLTKLVAAARRAPTFCANQREDVLPGEGAVRGERARLDLQQREVLVEQLRDGGGRLWAALLVDLHREPPQRLLGLGFGLRPGRDDFPQVVPALSQRIDAGVHHDPQRAAGQHLDPAA